MPTTKLLNSSKSVVLDSAGSGTVDIQVPALETWRVTRIAVHVNSNTDEPTATVYIDALGPGNILSATYTGSLDSSDENQVLMPNQHMLCRWEGGDSGATATISVFGERTS